MSTDAAAAGHYRPPVPASTLVAIVLVPVVAVCVAAAARSLDPRRAVLLAIPVGLMFGTIDVLTKTALHRLAIGGLSGMFGAPAKSGGGSILPGGC